MESAIPVSKTLNPLYLPSSPLFGSQKMPGMQPGSGIGWALSPEPFGLTEGQLGDIHRFGEVLWEFLLAADRLYQASLKGEEPAWIAALLEQGKPEGLTRFAQMKRFKRQLPTVIRPDLLMTETGWALCEIDSVPGGIGFTAALNQAYRQSGFNLVESVDTMPLCFWQMLKEQTPDVENPVVAVVVSDEASDYRQELAWLVESLRTSVGAHIYLVHPQQLDWVRDRLTLTDETGVERVVQTVYRFFELFDLPNIPKIELIQYAVKKGAVQCIPPWKPHLEEKLLLALLHHPVLEAFWLQSLGEANFYWLKQWTPTSWILDPTPPPPQAVIPGLRFGARGLHAFQELARLSQSERRLVIKPSGFSPMAWGSRGVTVGHDVPGAVWEKRLTDALEAFPKMPHILQEYRKPSLQRMNRIDAETGAITAAEVRVRLCPYFFVMKAHPELAGILATACSKDKKIIHGMQDALLAPVMQL